MDDFPWHSVVLLARYSFLFTVLTNYHKFKALKQYNFFFLTNTSVAKKYNIKFTKPKTLAELCCFMGLFSPCFTQRLPILLVSRLFHFQSLQHRQPLLEPTYTIISLSLILLSCLPLPFF